MPANKTIGGLSNGTTYTIRVRAYTSMDGVRYTGDPSAASNGAVPYGPVKTPGAKATASGQSIVYEWSAPADNGRTIQVMQINIGSGWENVGRSGSRTVNYGYSHTGTIQVKAMDTEGQWSAVASDSATTVAKPQPSATTVKGASVNSSTCTSSSCAYLAMDVSNFPAGDYSVRCNDSRTGPNSWRTVYGPADGRVQMTCYFGYPGAQAWIDFENGPVGRSAPLTWY
jgi:hypothetical protein